MGFGIINTDGKGWAKKDDENRRIFEYIIFKKNDSALLHSHSFNMESSSNCKKS